MKGVIIVLEVFECVLEFGNVVVGSGSPVYLDVRGGDQAVEFKIGMGFRQSLRF